MAPGHPHRPNNGTLRRVGGIIVLLLFAATASPLRAQDGLYRARSPIEIDRTSQYPRLIWQVNLDSLAKIIREIGITDSSRFKCFDVPLGYWEYIAVEHKEDGTMILHDTVWTYPLPSVGDTAYLVASISGMSSIQVNMHNRLGVTRDTVRTTPGETTISFVRDSASGLYYGNLKEADGSYPYRVGQHGAFLGKDFVDPPPATVLLERGGKLAGRDTVVVRTLDAVVMAFMETDTTLIKRVQHTRRDTTRQVVDPAKYRGDPRLRFQLVNPTAVPIRYSVMKPERVWRSVGRDTTICLDTTQILCPKFAVDAQLTRNDTIRWKDTLYTDIPIYEYDTSWVFNCIKTFFLPTKWVVTQKTTLSQPITRAKLDSLKAVHGCVNTGDVRAIADSIDLEYYDLSNTFVGRVKRLADALAYGCDTSWDAGRVAGWNFEGELPWLNFNGSVAGTIRYNTKYCMIPYAALTADQPCGERVVVQPDPDSYQMVTASCCTHDSVVVFGRPSLTDPTRLVFGSYTYKVPIAPQCDYMRIDSNLVGYVPSGTVDRERIETRELEAPIYSVVITDTCDCNPHTATIELVNGDVRICEGFRIVSECGTTQPYLGADGRTIVLPCQQSEIWINGERSSQFDNIATHMDLQLISMWFKHIADSLGTACPPCVEEVLRTIDTLKTRLGTVEGEVDMLQTDVSNIQSNHESLTMQVDALYNGSACIPCISDSLQNYATLANIAGVVTAETDPVFTAVQASLAEKSDTVAQLRKTNPKIPGLATSDSNRVIGVGPSGELVLRWDDAGSGGGGAETDPVYTAAAPTLATKADTALQVRTTHPRIPGLRNTDTSRVLGVDGAGNFVLRSDDIGVLYEVDPTAPKKADSSAFDLGYITHQRLRDSLLIARDSIRALRQEIARILDSLAAHRTVLNGLGGGTPSNGLAFWAATYELDVDGVMIGGITSEPQAVVATYVGEDAPGQPTRWAWDSGEGLRVWGEPGRYVSVVVYYWTY